MFHTTNVPVPVCQKIVISPIQILISNKAILHIAKAVELAPNDHVLFGKKGNNENLYKLSDMM